MVPFSHPSPRTKQHLDPLIRFCTAHAAISVCFTVSRKVFPEIALFLGYPDPYIVLGSFGPLESHTRNGILIGSAHVDFQQTHISIFALCPGNQAHVVGALSCQCKVLPVITECAKKSRSALKCYSVSTFCSRNVLKSWRVAKFLWEYENYKLTYIFLLKLHVQCSLNVFLSTLPMAVAWSSGGLAVCYVLLVFLNSLSKISEFVAFEFFCKFLLHALFLECFCSTN